MKGILEFDLCEDIQEFLDAQRGTKWKYVVESIQQHLRKLGKYGGQETVNIEELRDWIAKAIQDEVFDR